MPRLLSAVEWSIIALMVLLVMLPWTDEVALRLMDAHERVRTYR